jgi:RNase P subunit RPR2
VLLTKRDPAKRHTYWIKYRSENTEHLAEIARKSKLKLKREVLSHYSEGKIVCAKCGYSDVRALGLDHINGRGSEQRKKGFVGNGYYSWLKKNGFPPGLQVLCMNCNWIKRVDNNELRRPRPGD